MLPVSSANTYFIDEGTHHVGAKVSRYLTCEHVMYARCSDSRESSSCVGRYVFLAEYLSCCCRFLSCVTTTQKFSSSDPTCAILIFVGAECLRTFVPHSIPMDVIVCLTITYIAQRITLSQQFCTDYVFSLVLIGCS